MFSIVLVTLKESRAASLYDTYAIEDETNYGDAQLQWTRWEIFTPLT